MMASVSNLLAPWEHGILNKSQRKKLDMVVHASNPHTGKAKAGES